MTALISRPSQFIIHLSFLQRRTGPVWATEKIETQHVTRIRYVTSQFERLSNVRLSKSISFLRLATNLGIES